MHRYSQGCTVASFSYGPRSLALSPALRSDWIKFTMDDDVKNTLSYKEYEEGERASDLGPSENQTRL